MTKTKSKTALTVYEKEKVPAVFSNQQLIHLLQATPAKHKYKRPAKGGGQWEYVTGAYIKKVLNYTFGFLWSSEHRDIEEKHGQITATVRLTIHKPDGSVLIWKEDVGKKDVMYRKDKPGVPLDYGNDKKAAITDGLKRCAAQFGIASDVYGKEEFKEIELEKVKVEEAPVEELADKPATSAQIENIKNVIGYSKMEANDKDFWDEQFKSMTYAQAVAKTKEVMGMGGKK